MTYLSRRNFLVNVAATAAATSGTKLWATARTVDDGAHLPKPTPQQAAWQDLEIGLFVGMDINWCDPQPKPASQRQADLYPADVFNPARLDTDQWMDVARAAGAKYSVAVAKGGTGFLQWPSDIYPYGVKQAGRFRGGKGDMIRAYVESAARYGIKTGYYCCLHWNSYLNVVHVGRVTGKHADPAAQARYARMSEQMVRELLERYGETTEFWFDGGYMPKEKGGPDLYPIFAKYGPRTMYFQAQEWSTIRWCGNEEGIAGDPCWATVSSKAAVMQDARQRAHGDVHGEVWLPAECDTPLPGHAWGWRKDEKRDIDPLPSLLEMYYRTVGRNANFLLEAPCNAEGVIPAYNVRHYEAFGQEIRRRFGRSLAETAGDGKELTLALPRPGKIDHVMVMEDILQGERIREFVVEGLVPDNQWKELCRGKSVGHKRIERFAPREVAKVRLKVTQQAATPRIRKLAVYNTAVT